MALYCTVQGSLEYGVDEDDEEGGPGEHWTPRRRDHELQQPGGPDSAAYGTPTHSSLLLSTLCFTYTYNTLVHNTGYYSVTAFPNLLVLHSFWRV